MLTTLLAFLPLAPAPVPLGLQGDVPILHIDLPTRGAQQVWQPICLTPAPGTLAELEGAVSVHTGMLARPTVIGTGSSQPSGFDIVFVGSGLPAAAVTALTACETYLESLFSDPITVTIQVSFQVIDEKYLALTGSSKLTVLYADARPLVVSDMDGNDTLQAFLPSGPAFPVDYLWFALALPLPSSVGQLGFPAVRVGNNKHIAFHFANWKAVGGTVTGTDAAISFNSLHTFDYDPSDGIDSTKYSFRDVVIHEVGHALGFSSAGDTPAFGDSKMLDLFRFRRTDGLGDANPDTLAEFQTYPRHVVKGLPNNDHISDLITVEYGMADGDPRQMSHFRNQSPRLGLMDTHLVPGVTYHPGYFTAADLAMLDAIGYDH